jgi:hypothetical protein
MWDDRDDGHRVVELADAGFPLREGRLVHGAAIGFEVAVGDVVHD